MALPDPSSDTIAIVTGASSGIGTELARGLARRGHNVGLVARRRDRLEEIAGEIGGDVRAEVLEADLEDASSRDALAGQIESLGLSVSVLCNNAGFGTYDDFCELDRERELSEVRTNVEAVVDLTGRYLPGMVERGSGGVLNTASTAAFQPIPGNATYAASKAFVLSFSEALHTEVAGNGVTVTALCPGPVKTEFQDVNDSHDFASKLPKPLWVAPEAVAEQALRGLEKGKRVVTPGVSNRVSGAASRATPNSVLLRVLRSVS
jgi:short-subunit dehydrogenase